MAITSATIAGYSNAEVSNMVGRKLPLHFFTSVKTSRVEHYFADGSGTLPARVIVLTRTEVFFVWQAVKDFFWSLFGGGNDPVNVNAVEAFIFGSATADDRERTVSALARSKIIRLYISEQGDHVDSEFVDSTLVVTARLCGTRLHDVFI